MTLINKALQAIFAIFRSLISLSFLPRWLRWALRLFTAALALAYLTLFIIVGNHAKHLLAHPPTQKADVGLVLGNRAYINGAPNPCLTGRVDEGVALAQQGLLTTLVMTGGVDDEDGRTEAQTMQAWAISQGFKGPILLESKSESTLENFKFSRPILLAAGVKNVIVVSEPYHMWRAEQLVNAGHFGRDFKVTYAAAPSYCWVTWGMAFKGALREPVAIMNNYAKGYFEAVN
jgi:uncharacterized SAM-binding protein YcdF (DUF218 family)